MNVSLWNTPIPVLRVVNSSPLHGPRKRSVFCNKAALELFGFTQEGFSEFLTSGNTSQYVQILGCRSSLPSTLAFLAISALALTIFTVAVRKMAAPGRFLSRFRSRFSSLVWLCMICGGFRAAAGAGCVRAGV